MKKLRKSRISSFLLVAGSLFLVATFLNHLTPSVIDFTAPRPLLVSSTQASTEKLARLVIDSIGVDAAIQEVGVTTKGNLGIPTNFTDVGWYKSGPLPGDVGSAVIVGHLNGLGVPKAVFYNLDKLKIGDVVKVVDLDGKEIQFKVVGRKIYDYNAKTDEVFVSDNFKSRLNLITCTGVWVKSQKLYNQRLVVFTEIIE